MNDLAPVQGLAPATRLDGGSDRLLQASGLDYAVGRRRILEGVELAVSGREIVTIVGPNGSGKTTLLRLLIGALTPTRGRITRQPGLRIGYVPQKLGIDPTLPLTVASFLSLAHGRHHRDERARALAATGLADLGHAAMADLSGGEMQRVMLARALLRKPGLLVLDEPTQGLDQPGEAAFYRLIERLRDETGCAVLMVSHDLHVVMSGSDRVICLNGHICCQGTPMSVSDHPAYRALFGFGTEGALALYRHEHDHRHDHGAHHHGHHDGHAPAEAAPAPSHRDDQAAPPRTGGKP